MEDFAIRIQGIVQKAKIHSLQAVLPHGAPQFLFQDGLIPQGQILHLWELSCQLVQIQFIGIAGEGNPVEILRCHPGQ